jgi:hypothetical protein
MRSALPLGCQVSMVREWVRVVCSGSRRGGGAIEGIEVKGGCSKDTYPTMRRQATVVTALSEGRRCEVLFRWADGVSTFSADWPSSARPSLNFSPVGAAPPPSASARLLDPRAPIRR